MLLSCYLPRWKHRFDMQTVYHVGGSYVRLHTFWIKNERISCGCGYGNVECLAAGAIIFEYELLRHVFSFSQILLAVVSGAYDGPNANMHTPGTIDQSHAVFTLFEDTHSLFWCLNWIFLALRSFPMNINDCYIHPFQQWFMQNAGTRSKPMRFYMKSITILLEQIKSTEPFSIYFHYLPTANTPFIFVQDAHHSCRHCERCADHRQSQMPPKKRNNISQWPLMDFIKNSTKPSGDTRQ